jgi:hypothetical protein
MEAFSCLRIEMLKHGFSEVHFLELFCLTCGSWRCGIEFPQPEIACPKCGVLKRASYFGCSGFSRTPGKWERFRAPFSPGALGFLFAKPVDEVARLRKRQEQKGRTMPYYQRSKLRELAPIT